MNLGVNPLADGLPEPWAAEWGWGHFGVFVGFGIGGVVRRMRWVPSFTMGSPAEETGRFEDEGPQHEVEIGQGFWLGETPVTQALWKAAMGNNPSRFKSPDRPVEQVSWQDCQEFCKKLNERVPGLDARLPSEAEWSTRAGQGRRPPPGWAISRSSARTTLRCLTPSLGTVGIAVDFELVDGAKTGQDSEILTPAPSRWSYRALLTRRRCAASGAKPRGSMISPGCQAERPHDFGECLAAGGTGAPR